MRIFQLSVATLLAAVQPILANTVIVPPETVVGESIGQWTAGAQGFDAPKVQPINSTAYDWWYFDIVSSSQNNDTAGLPSFVVVFYTATAGGFTPLISLAQNGYNSMDLVQITAGYGNGTTFEASLNGTQATLTTCGDFTRGAFVGDAGAANFSGSSDLSFYIVTIHAPEMGIVGSLELKSIAPPHYAGGVAFEGQDMQIAPHIGWANAVPDSAGNANFVIEGQDFNITGYGYHDKNWGVASFAAAVDSWYWGHGRLGEYSVVWFDYLGPAEEKSVSAYVAQDKNVLIAEPSGIQVRPIGENSTYPPLSTTGAPGGFHVDVDVAEGTLSFDVIGKEIIQGSSSGAYTRWVGWMTGGLNNATDLQGAALYEQFAFAS
ncbi:hydroxyneuurosporene synthase domain-containing protein [Seiridium cupressi]